MPAAATAKSSAPARRAPARKPAPRRRQQAPRRRPGHTPVTGFVPVAVGRTAGAVGGLADSGLVVRLTRSRLWIGLLGGLLVGIVALNVLALSFSASSSNAARQADELRRQNSALRGDIATRLSSDEIEAAATRLGLFIPEPGAIGYLRPSPDDAAEAARRLRAGELGSAGYVPVDPALAATETAIPATTVPVAGETEAPVTPVAPETTEPVAPVEPAAPVAPAEPVVGGVAAP